MSGLIWNYFHVPGVKPRSSVSSKEEVSEDDHHRCNKNTIETKVFSQSLAAAIPYSPVCVYLCVCVWFEDINILCVSGKFLTHF